MSDSSSWTHFNPVRVICAPLESLHQHVRAKSVLLVTTPGFVKRGVVQRVKNILESHHMMVWAQVKPNPDLQDLDAATKSLQGCDIGCVLGLGGGSALDVAKVLATTIPSSPQPTLKQVFRDKVATCWASRLPLIAIPTTAGTGAEVTPFATVWDHQEHQKYSLAGDFLYPDVALLDATLTLSLSEDETLFPALDTVSHALESLWNKNSTPISRIYAYEAIRLWNRAYPKIRQNPDNVLLRKDLMIASTLAGKAISQTKTAIAHAISYNLTIEYGIPHGLACSFTLPFLIEENMYKIATDNFELSLIDETKKILTGLGFDEMLKKYATRNEIISKVVDLGDNSRTKNYIDIENCCVEEILKGSV